MRRFVAILLLAGACAKAPPKKLVLDVAPKPRDPLAGPKKVLTTAYRALEKGEADKLKPLLTTGVLAFGLAPSDTFNKRDGIVNMVRQELLPISLRGHTLRFSESRIVGVLAPGNRSAVLYDLPRLELDEGNRIKVWLPRITAHAVLEEEWRLDAVHVSIGIPEERLYAADATRAFLPPGDVTPEVKGDADQLVGLTRRLLADMTTRLNRLSDREEVVQLGTAPGDIYQGGKPFKELVRPLLKQLKKSGANQEVQGNFRARLAPGGHTGWVAAHVVLTVGKGRKQQVLPPFRGLWIYAEEHGVWNLMSEHLSLALKANQRLTATEEALEARRAAENARQKVQQAQEAADAAARAPPEKETPDAGQPAEAPMDAW